MCQTLQEWLKDIDKNDNVMAAKKFVPHFGIKHSCRALVQLNFFRLWKALF